MPRPRISRNNVKGSPTTILLYGRDTMLLETRNWLLQTRGYRVFCATEYSAIAELPTTVAIDLLILCHSLSREERTAALAVAAGRWPPAKHLTLSGDIGRAPQGILGQLFHTADGPGKLIAQVADLVGPASRPVAPAAIVSPETSAAAEEKPA